MAHLAEDGIETRPHALAQASLEVLGSGRKILTSKAYLSGRVELQDVASQAVIDDIPVAAGQKVLDYCAGGGGKTLALAAREKLKLWAHDANPARMHDLPVRASRAGATIGLLDDARTRAPFDLVLVDAPCSGSGSWRRDPQGKWALTPARLAELISVQASILDQTAPLVEEGGVLAYVTCSLIADENQGQIADFVRRHPDWREIKARQLLPTAGGDGFFLSILAR